MTNEDCIEEIVCNAIMSIATDENALQKALKVAHANENILDKIAQAFSNLVEKIKEFLTSFTDNKAAKIFAKDVETLEQLAEMFSEAAENANAVTTEQKNNTVRNDGVKYSMNKSFAQQVDDVLNNQYDKNNHVYMGDTPQVLINILGIQKLPMLVTNNHVYSMSVSKEKAKTDGRFSKNTNYHNLGNMVKELPKLLNNPLMIIKSNTKPNDSTFIVVTNAIDKDSNPVIAVIKPDGKGNYYDVELDSNVLLSAYGKKNFNGYLNSSFEQNRILYVNKNSQQTNTTGVQFPNNILSVDYNNNLARFKQIVNNNSMQKLKNNSNDEGGAKYSYGGIYAKTANYTKLAKAMEMEKNGDDSETIRHNTGWFRGYDDKWRFEIDDSKIEYSDYLKDTKKISSYYLRCNDLEAKIKNDTATDEEIDEYYELDEKIIEYQNSSKRVLSSVIKHPQLFEAYPELRNIKVKYNDEVDLRKRGMFVPEMNTILINPNLLYNERKETLIHEIQHAIQHIEGFAKGSSITHWHSVDPSKKNGRSDRDLYESTAGEVEARDAANRMNLTAEQRKNTRPDIDRTDVVFAEGSGVSMEIVTLDNGKQYVRASEKPVIIGNDSGRWASQIANYINKNIRNWGDFKLQTVEGDYLTITRDTAYKAGTRNSIKNPDGTYRKMTDSEYKTKLNAEVHINELAELSKKVKSNLVMDTKNHKFAKDGFQYRNVYFQDYDGTYYAITLSVGVNGDISTIYNVGKIRKDTLPSGNIKSTYRGSRANSVSTTNLSQKKAKVNTENFDGFSDIKFSMDDTVYDYITGEYGTAESQMDFKNIIERNPNAAMVMIYRNALETARKGLYLSERIELPDKICRNIAKKALIDIGVNTKKKYKPVTELSKLIKEFTDTITLASKSNVTASEYFINLFEDFANTCSKYIDVSEWYNTTHRKNVRDYCMENY